MTFKELKKMIDKMSKEQLEEKVQFGDEDDFRYIELIFEPMNDSYFFNEVEE